MTKKAVALLFFYGIVLCLCGVGFAGAGHGTYTVLGLAGSPLAILGIPFAIIAALLQWGAIGLLRRKYRPSTWPFAIYLVGHYATATVLLLLPISPYSDWEVVRKFSQTNQKMLIFAFAWYVLGQVFLWRLLLANRETAAEW